MRSESLCYVTLHGPALCIAYDNPPSHAVVDNTIDFMYATKHWLSFPSFLTEFWGFLEHKAGARGPSVGKCIFEIEQEIQVVSTAGLVSVQSTVLRRMCRQHVKEIA